MCGNGISYCAWTAAELPSPSWFRITTAKPCKASMARAPASANNPENDDKAIWTAWRNIIATSTLGDGCGGRVERRGNGGHYSVVNLVDPALCKLGEHRIRRAVHQKAHGATTAQVHHSGFCEGHLW